MLQAEGQSLKMRDIIFLNETAQPWTRGLIMTVHEVKRWGVICWTTEATSSDSHSRVRAGLLSRPMGSNSGARECASRAPRRGAAVPISRLGGIYDHARVRPVRRGGS